MESVYVYVTSIVIVRVHHIVVNSSGAGKSWLNYSDPPLAFGHMLFLSWFLRRGLNNMVGAPRRLASGAGG